MEEIKNLQKVSNRILKAIKNKGKIILYGDTDLDGVTSVIILRETIKNLGGQVTALYFPDREKEGYGINETALNSLEKFTPALFIALDCGIGNFKETEIAKKLGFEVIIVDHHEILEKLPQAKIIVDPKQKGDKSLFKELAAVGIVFKLSELLLEDKMTDLLRKNFLELVALATLADMMPQESENRIFIEEGLSSLGNSWRPGIKALFETDYFQNYSNFNQKISKIISILNVRDAKDNFPASFWLLTSSSIDDGKEIIQRLIEKSEIRREKIREIAEKVESEISKKTESVIFIGNPDWDSTLLSPVASIICQKYQKPTFIFKKGKTESQGTVRMPKGSNGVKMMMKCSKLLKTYGGHALAAGFRVKNENLEKFKKCLIRNLCGK